MDAESCPLLSRPSHTDLGNIFRSLGNSFLQQERLNTDQRRVFRHIAECHTAALGGARCHCESCGKWFGVYHSCRDRHCPACQGERRQQWVRDRLADCLPVPYFHVVFTLPHQTNTFIFNNPSSCLKLLFKCAAETLKGFAANPKFLGAEPGITMVLHTWGQKLNLHYHVHCIVTCGGFKQAESRWVSPPRHDFLFPVRAMGRVFRGKFLSGLDTLKESGCFISFSDSDWTAFKRRLAKRKRWNIYAKPPYGKPENLIKYLAQYTNRVALSNERILSYQDNKVLVKYKQYQKDNFISRTMSLADSKLALLFLQHVLPKGFMRIRHYGFLANCKKSKMLAVIRRLMTILGKETSLLDQEKPRNPPSENSNSDACIMAQDTPPLRPAKCPFCKSESITYFGDLAETEKARARSLLWDTS